MKKYTTELSVGLFVLLGLLCVAYLTIRLGKMDVFSSKGYEVYAQFSSIAGLRAGAQVEIAGVPVGKVAKIELAPDYRAKVYLRINEGVQLSDDVGAAVKTSGIIGDKYINLSLGGSMTDLAPGEEITQTQSTIDIESLISNYVLGSVEK